jgi:hypothetical protein
MMIKNRQILTSALGNIELEAELDGGPKRDENRLFWRRWEDNEELLGSNVDFKDPLESALDSKIGSPLVWALDKPDSGFSGSIHIPPCSGLVNRLGSLS